MPTDELVESHDCDREPIHQLGAIQPFGFLLAITSDWKIVHASENVIDFLDVAADQIIGAPLPSLVAHDAFQTLRQAVAQLRDTETLARHFALRLLLDAERRFGCALPLSNDRIVLEVEPSRESPEVGGASLIRSIISNSSPSSRIRLWITRFCGVWRDAAIPRLIEESGLGLRNGVAWIRMAR